MDRSTDPTQLFAPPVLAWLAGRGCEEAGWVDAANAASPDVRQLDFVFDMGPVPVASVAVRLGFREAGALAEADIAAVSAYLAALQPFLRETGASNADRRVVLSRETLLAVEHQLRNHLNSLLMNAALLSLQCQSLGLDDPCLEQMECEGQNCLDVLRWLADAAN